MSSSARSFHFRGELPLSKSLLNRWMVLLSFDASLWNRHRADLKCLAKRSGEDTHFCFESLDRIVNASENSDEPMILHCGEGGAPFRFIALRASRRPGKYQITGSPRLLQRPMQELLQILQQLQVQSEWRPDQGLWIDSKGWLTPISGALEVDRRRSSQFLSAVLLSSVGLPFELSIQSSVDGAMSEPYAEMTLQMLQNTGAWVQGSLSSGWIRLAPHSDSLDPDFWNSIVLPALESDWSAAWSIAGHAAVIPGGQAHLPALRLPSLQPDSVSLEILRKMGVEVQQPREREFLVCSSGVIKGVECDLRGSPDLFPVLVALASLAQTPSRLTGLESLQYKESHRLLKMKSLVESLGARVMALNGSDLNAGVEVVPIESAVRAKWLDVHFPQVDCDPDHDHRIAMAASVLRLAGAPLRIHHPEVVNKSFPEFWQQVDRAKDGDQGK